MRYPLFLVPLAVLAAPAVAAPAAERDQIQIPRELTDPAMADKLATMMEALSKAFLDLPVGEVQAAAEGRPATQSDRNRTVRDVARISERDLERQIEQSKPMIEQSMKALAHALPAMMKSLSQAAEQLERATANIPQPGYPRP